MSRFCIVHLPRFVPLVAIYTFHYFGEPILELEFPSNDTE